MANDAMPPLNTWSAEDKQAFIQVLLCLLCLVVVVPCIISMLAGWWGKSAAQSAGVQPLTAVLVGVACCVVLALCWFGVGRRE